MRRTSMDSRPEITEGCRRERGARRLLAALLVGAGSLLGAAAATAGEEVPDPGTDPGDEGTVLIGEGHAWRFFRGTQDPPADWTGVYVAREK